MNSNSIYPAVYQVSPFRCSDSRGEVTIESRVKGVAGTALGIIMVIGGISACALGVYLAWRWFPVTKPVREIDCFPGSVALVFGILGGGFGTGGGVVLSVFSACCAGQIKNKEFEQFKKQLESWAADEKAKKVIIDCVRYEEKELNLSSKGLKTFPEGIEKLTNVTKWTLNDNEFTAFPKWIVYVNQNSTIDLQRNNFSKGVVEKLQKIVGNSEYSGPHITFQPPRTFASLYEDVNE